MKSIKNLKKQAFKAATLSFKSGKLNDSISKKFIKSFKALPLGESIPALNFYYQAIKREISKTTLTIMSVTKVSPTQEKELENIVKKNFKILSINSQINPSLLGGVKVKIGDIIYDNSLQARVNQVKEALVG